MRAKVIRGNRKRTTCADDRRHGIIGGGILEHYPKLEVTILQAGAGWLPCWAVPLMKKPPSE
jgi:hypothetical protein